MPFEPFHHFPAPSKLARERFGLMRRKLLGMTTLLLCPARVRSYLLNQEDRTRLTFTRMKGDPTSDQATNQARSTCSTRSTVAFSLS